MDWKVIFDDGFDAEFAEMPEAAQDELLAFARLLSRYGPQLSRPHADTLNGSSFANMKELRFAADGGVWRTAFAFDPERNAILLALGDKSGGGERRFYKTLIARADKRYQAHLNRLANRTKGKT